MGQHECIIKLERGIISNVYDDDFVKRYCHEIENSDAKFVILDLRGINFLDSAGIALIVRLHKYCGEADRYFSLRHVSDEVKDLLHKTNLDRVIPIA